MTSPPGILKRKLTYPAMDAEPEDMEVEGARDMEGAEEERPLTEDPLTDPPAEHAHEGMESDEGDKGTFKAWYVYGIPK